MLDQNRAAVGEPVEVFCAALCRRTGKTRKDVADYFIIEPDARLYSGTGVTFLNIVTPVYSGCQYITALIQALLRCHQNTQHAA